MFWLIITFLIAFAGAFICYRLKIAGGIIAGAMFFVAIFNIITGLAYFPMYAKVFAQIISGAFIGVGINRCNIIQLKQVIKPAMVLISGMFIINIVVGLLIYALSPLDLSTSLFSSVPGGVSDMTIISHDMGADTSKVAILQLIRLVSTLALFPSIINKVSRYMSHSINNDENMIYEKDCLNSINNIEGTKEENRIKERDICSNNTEISKNNTDKDFKKNPDEKTIKEYTVKNVCYTLIIAFISGVVGYISGLPAGTLVFSIIGVSSFNIATDKACLPMSIKRFAQVVAGAFIGTSFVRSDLAQLKLLILPAIIQVTGYIILCTLLGILISKLFNIDIPTSLFSSAPAGASDMALIASDLGASGPKVALLQIVRLVSVIAVCPWIIKLTQNAVQVIFKF